MFDPAKRKRNKQALDFEFKTERSLKECLAQLKAVHNTHSDYSMTFVRVEPIEEMRWQFTLTRKYQPIPPYPSRKRVFNLGLSTIDVEVGGKLIEHDTGQTSVYASARIAQATVIGQRIKIAVIVVLVSIIAIGAIVLNLEVILLCASIFFLLLMVPNQRAVHNDHYINQTVSYTKQLLV